MLERLEIPRQTKLLSEQKKRLNTTTTTTTERTKVQQQQQQKMNKICSNSIIKIQPNLNSRETGVFNLLLLLFMSFFFF